MNVRYLDTTYKSQPTFSSNAVFPHPSPHPVLLSHHLILTPRARALHLVSLTACSIQDAFSSQHPRFDRRCAHCAHSALSSVPDTGPILDTYFQLDQPLSPQ